MKFSEVLQTLQSFLAAEQSPYAVIGGVALASYGIARTTLDLDLVAPRQSQTNIIEFLEAEGYSTLHRSKGFSNHLHDDPHKGRVDLVYVDEATADQLFERTKTLQGPGGQAIRVPCPEHLAAMKVLAMKNDPGRTFQDLADIRQLLLLPGVDREEIRQSFAKQNLLERFCDLETTL